MNPTSMQSSPNEERINELLADKAVFGLSAEEDQELAKLIKNSDRKEDDSFERAAAAIDLSMAKVDQMPAALSEKLRAQGREAMQDTGAGEKGVDLTERGIDAENGPTNDASAVITPAEPPNRVNEIVAWATAIAIGFVALWIWTDARSTTGTLSDQLTELNSRLDALNGDKEKLVQQNASLVQKNVTLGEQNETLGKENESLVVQKDSLIEENKILVAQLPPSGEDIYRSLAKRDDVIKWKWSATKDSQGTGDIVWDEESQTGAMRFVNLEVNDPATKQYQLWIIEANGRQKYPIDGGVFDIEGSGEVFVPIDAKLYAGTPAAFAITIEDKHGVVVSTKEDLPLLAKAESN